MLDRWSKEDILDLRKSVNEDHVIEARLGLFKGILTDRLEDEIEQSLMCMRNDIDDFGKGRFPKVEVEIDLKLVELTQRCSEVEDFLIEMITELTEKGFTVDVFARQEVFVGDDDADEDDEKNWQVMDMFGKGKWPKATIIINLESA